MSAVVLASTKGMDRDTWLAWRRRGLGGSDAPAVCGLSPWRSPLRVYLEKRGEIAPEPETEAMRWGTLLEPVVAAEFAARTGWRVRRRHAILRHPEHAFMIGNIDRMVRAPEGEVPLEVKTTSPWLAEDWENGLVPDPWMIQCQHYLAVGGWPAAYIAVLIGGQRLGIKRIPRDEDLIRDLIEIEASFWDRVERGDPPPADGSPDAAEVLRERFPHAIPGTTVALPVEAREWIARYHDAARREEEAKRDKEAAANLLRQALADAERGVLFGVEVVRYPAVTRRVLDTKRLKDERPDIYEAYATVQTTRRLTLLKEGSAT